MQLNEKKLQAVCRFPAKHLVEYFIMIVLEKKERTGKTLRIPRSSR